LSETLRKAMMILDELRLSDHGLSARELATKVDLPKSTVQRLLQSLEEARMTVQDPASRKYALGPKTLTLGMAYRERLDLRNAALPHMRALRDLTNETIGLSVVVGHERMFTEEVQSQSELRAQTELGVPYPLWQGAPGRVLLAHLPAGQIDDVLAGAGDQAWRSVGLADREALAERLAAIRRDGHDRAFDETIAGVSAIAAPVRDASGRVAAALSLSAPSGRMGPAAMDRVLPEVATAAEKISGALGG